MHGLLIKKSEIQKQYSVLASQKKAFTEKVHFMWKQLKTIAFTTHSRKETRDEKQAQLPVSLVSD